MVVLLARKPLLMQQHALQDHWFWLGTWWVLVFVGHAIIYREKKYSEVHSEASAVYVISLNHMQTFSRNQRILCLAVS